MHPLSFSFLEFSTSGYQHSWFNKKNATNIRKITKSQFLQAILSIFPCFGGAVALKRGIQLKF